MNAKEFTEKYYVKRNNTDSIKWDDKEAKGKLPMWIADADFRLDDKVIEMLNKRISHGSFGYSYLPEDYLDTMINWNKDISNVTYKKEWIRFSCGAINGLTQVICSLTNEKDAILMTTPIYHHFFHTIKTTKRKLVESSLNKEGTYFSMNYKDIENKIVKNNVKMMILCSPCNPVGRIWTKEELEKLFAITHKHNVIVVSDEVHGELVMPGYKFIPSLTLKKYQNDIITLNAESKSFSLAMFSFSHIICPNKKYRNKIDEYQKYYDIQSPNGFNGLATYYCYKYGKEWLQGFNNTVYENYLYVEKHLSKYCEMTKLEGSYLLYLDFSKSIKEGSAYEFLKDKCNILVSSGEQFKKGYDKWARLNLATSLANVKKACTNIEKELKNK